MARRRRQDSLLGGALKNNWQYAALVAIFALIGGRILVPAFAGTAGMFAPFFVSLTSIANWVALAFGTIALFKLIAAALRGAEGITGTPRTPARTMRTTPARREYSPPRSPAPPPRQEAPQSPQDRPQAQSQTQAQLQAPAAPAEKPTAWSLEVLQNIEWRLFEELCAAYYREKGIRCDTTALGPDGGIDIRLYQDEAEPTRTTAIVQCKATRIAGIKPMRELLGVMAHEKLEKGFFMTSGEFTDDSKAFGQQNRVVPIDGKLLLTLIQRLPADAQARLLALGTRGAWNIPSCPECGRKMIRKDPVGKKPFWSCKLGPCKGRLNMRYERF